MWDLPADLGARYQPLEEIGRGAFGRVLAARDTQLDRRVAIKAAPLSGKLEVRRRFEREGKVLGAIRHPNVVEVFDLTLTEDEGYLVMELLEGAPLSEGFGQRPPLDLMLEVAGGLQAAHDAGVLHRDLKPDNVFLTRSGRPVLVDFGFAYEPERTRMTEAGQVLGTIAYMAPELLDAGRPTTATDWYAWGATLYCVVEGRPPFGLEELLGAVRGEGLPAPTWRRCQDPRLRALVEACMAEDPAARPPDAGALDARGRGDAAVGPAPGAATRESQLVPAQVSQQLGRISTGSLTTRPAARWRPAAAALVVAGALGWALGPTSGPAPGDAAPTPEDPAPAGPRGDRPGVSLAAVLSTLDLAGAWLVNQHGEVTRDHQGALPPGSQPLLDGDPHAWGPLLGAVPGLGAWARAVAQQDPATFAPDERRALAAVDEHLERQGTLPVFAPLLEAGAPHPLDPAAPLPEAPRRRRGAPLHPAYLARGWAPAAARALSDAARIEADLTTQFDSFATGRHPDHALHGLAPPTIVMTMNLNEYLEGYAWSPAQRAQIAAWARAGTQRIRHGLACAVRALRVAPRAQRDALAVDLGERIARANGLLRTELCMTDPAQLGFDLELSAQEAYVAGSIMVTQAGVRKRAKRGAAAHVERTREVLALARADAAPDAPEPARVRACLAMRHEVTLLKDFGRHPDALDLLRRERKRIEALPMNHRLDLMTTYARLLKILPVRTDDGMFVVQFLSDTTLHPRLRQQPELAEIKEISLGIPTPEGLLEVSSPHAR